MAQRTTSHDDRPIGPSSTPVPGIDRRAVSRHTGAGSGTFAVEARQLNASCVLPGSPFSGGLVLRPNDPGEQPPTVTLGPLGGAQIDAVTCLFASSPQHSNQLMVRAQALDPRGEPIAESRLVLAAGGHGPLTLQFRPAEGGVRLRLDVSFDRFDGGAEYGSVEMTYLAAYSDNDLMRLCNAAGSDKGSETYWGDGFPHFYALTYEALFSPWRQERFNFLEIGLDAATYASGQPADAPSLRVWREFLPAATLYGYDLHDFGFFDQSDTHVFQGDQSSRADIRRFVEAAGTPRFRVVLDDGSHAASHQQVSLAALFEHVEPSGVYIIEDLDWQPYDEAPRTREVLQRFAEGGTIESPFISATESRRLEATIAGVQIYRPNDFEFAVITKKSAPRSLRAWMKRRGREVGSRSWRGATASSAES